MWRVVLDANVWVSAFAFDGSTPLRIVSLVRSRKIRSVTSEPIIDQVVRALQRLGVSSRRIQIAETNIRQISRLVEPISTIDVIAEKDSDNRVLECAIVGDVDAIVTGDRKHLLPLKTYSGILILSPSTFLEIVDRDGL